MQTKDLLKSKAKRARVQGHIQLCRGHFYFHELDHIQLCRRAFLLHPRRLKVKKADGRLASRRAPAVSC